MYYKLKLLLAGSAMVLTSAYVKAQDSDTVKLSRYSRQDFRTWSFGINGGILSGRALLSMPDYTFKTDKGHVGYGAFIKKQFSPDLGIQADFMAGKVEKGGFLENGNPLPNSGYKTDVNWSFSLTALYNITRIYYNNSWGVIIPYVRAGAGFMSFDAHPYNVPGGLIEGKKRNWTIPTGAGLKIALTRGINLDLGYDIYFVRSKKFDGTLTERNDRIGYGRAGLEFAIGRRNKVQLQSYDPVVTMIKQSYVLNQRVADAELKANNIYQRYEISLLDDDNDGVANRFDKCPGTSPDAKVDGAGCPLSPNDCRVLKEAFDNLEFEFAKAIVKSTSFASLDRLANLLITKNFSLKIAGHTDNVGPRLFNYKLSKDRAEATKAYLVGKGVNPSRVEATGYGPDQPIASNLSEYGRQKNRRVELTLY